MPVSTRVTADGKPVSPNYKGDLADYKPDFRPGGKHKKAPPRRYVNIKRPRAWPSGYYELKDTALTNDAKWFQRNSCV